MGSSIKVDFEEFDGKGSFSMWKVWVEDLLVQHKLDLTLEECPEGITDRQWMSLEKRTCSAIRGCLADSTLYLVLEENPQRALIKVAHPLPITFHRAFGIILKQVLM